MPKSTLTPTQKLAKKLSADAVTILRNTEKSITRADLQALLSQIAGRQFAPAVRKLANNDLILVSGSLEAPKYKRTGAGTQVLKVIDKSAAAA